MNEPVRRCCFPDAVGRRVAGCTKARKSTKQYRRTVDCVDSDAHELCAAWLDRVRLASRFALGTTHAPAALPAPAAGKLQCGGLLGMADLLEGESVKRVDDVSRLMRRAITRYDSFESVPLEPVIQRVHKYDAENG